MMSSTELDEMQLEVAKTLQAEIFALNCELKPLYANADQLQSEVSALQEEILKIEKRYSRLESRMLQSSWLQQQHSQLDRSSSPVKEKSPSHSPSPPPVTAGSPASTQRGEEAPPPPPAAVGPSISFGTRRLSSQHPSGVDSTASLTQDGKRNSLGSGMAGQGFTSTGTQASKLRLLRRLQQQNETLSRRLILNDTQLQPSNQSLSRSIQSQRNTHDMTLAKASVRSAEEEVDRLKYRLFVLNKRKLVKAKEMTEEESVLVTKMLEKSEEAGSTRGALQLEALQMEQEWNKWNTIYKNEQFELEKMKEACASLKKRLSPA